MKKVLVLFALGVALILPATGKAQSDPPSVPITVGQMVLGQNYYNVYSLPLTIGGVSCTAWMDVQGQRGFILFRPPLEGSVAAQGQITSWKVNSSNSVGLPLSATMTYTLQADTDNDSDTDTAVGSITFYYSWQLNPPGYRRGWYVTLTGGAGAQSMKQN
jgi:hypothetical protein